ncbi:MAG TPA: PIN domain-containing protein [Polyangiaceae bacterium]|nr:PIN domain-containing protein [Polyangiaceae bacterium]
MILVDTNAWVAHLRRSDARLVDFLTQQRVFTTDVVVGELLLGSGLPKDFARLLSALPHVPTPRADETRAYSERHRRSLGGSGVGWADVQVLCAAFKAGARIHTADRAVRKVCGALGLALA